MSNSGEFYDHTSWPASGSSGSSASARQELDLIEAGFNKLPQLSGRANKLVKIGSGAADMTSSSLLSEEAGANLLIGATSARSVGGAIRMLQIEALAGEGSASILRHSASSVGPALVLAKSRGTTIGSSTIVQSGDMLGEVVFAGADGVDVETQGAIIRAEVDGTPGANDLPTRLLVLLTPDGSAVAVERMRLTTTGLGINTTAARMLHVMAPTGVAGAATFESPHTACAIALKDGATVTSPQIVSAGDDMYLQRGGSERLRVSSTGANVTGLFGVGKVATELAEFFTSTARARLILETTAAGQVADIQIKGAAGSAQWQLAAGIGSTHNLTFNVLGGAEILRLASTGHVKIGPAMTTARRLTVGDDASAAEYIQMRTSAAGTSGILFSDDSTAALNQGGVLYEHALDQMTLRTGNVPAVVIDSTQNIGIGTASPVTRVHVAIAGTAAASQVRVGNDTDLSYAQIQHIGSTFATTTRRNNMELVTSGATADIAFLPNGAERVKFTVAGEVLHGTSSAKSVQILGGAATYTNQVVGTASVGSGHAVILYAGPTAASAPAYVFGRSRGSTDGSMTVVASGDALGYTSWTGSDGTLFQEAARISVHVDGTPGASDMPGRLSVFTTPDGSATPSEALRVSNAGAVLAVRAGGTLGYGTGAGGAVTQTTSKSFGVTLNAAAGQITMNAASLAANTSVVFALTNSTIVATDVVIVNIRSGATSNAYHTQVEQVVAGGCWIALRNMTGGALAEAVVLNFAVIKAVAA